MCVLKNTPVGALSFLFWSPDPCFPKHAPGFPFLKGKQFRFSCQAGNRKSGNNDGAALLPAFRGCLNPAQVTDLSDSNMQEALELLQRLSDPNGKQ